MGHFRPGSYLCCFKLCSTLFKAKIGAIPKLQGALADVNNQVMHVKALLMGYWAEHSDLWKLFSSRCAAPVETHDVVAATHITHEINPLHTGHWQCSPTLQ